MNEGHIFFLLFMNLQCMIASLPLLNAKRKLCVWFRQAVWPYGRIHHVSALIKRAVIRHRCSAGCSCPHLTTPLILSPEICCSVKPHCAYCITNHTDIHICPELSCFPECSHNSFTHSVRNCRCSVTWDHNVVWCNGRWSEVVTERLEVQTPWAVHLTLGCSYNMCARDFG